MLEALRIRDFRLLWGAGVISSLGSWLLVLAIPAHVYLVTRSLAATGLTVAADYLPMLLLGPVAGVLADRWDRRRLMLAADLFRAAAVATMLLAAGRHGVWIFYPALVAESSGTVLFRPAWQARTPTIVGTGRTLNSANALNSVGSGIVRLIGGPAGGIMLAAFGIRVLICADVASYLISALAMVLTSRQADARPRRTATVRATVADLAEGLRALRRHRMAWTLLPVTVVFLTANASLSAIVVPFGLERLGGATQTGFVFAALGVGFLLGAPAVKVLLDRSPPGYVLAAALAGTAAGYVLLFFSASLAAACPAAVLVGLAGSMALVIPPTAVQRTVPDAVLGRISAAFLTGEAAATLIGALAGPVIARAFGLGGAAVVAAAATVLAAAAAGLTVPRSVQRDGDDGQGAQAQSGPLGGSEPLVQDQPGQHDGEARVQRDEHGRDGQHAEVRGVEVGQRGGHAGGAGKHGQAGGAERDPQRLPGLDRHGQREQQRAGLLARDRPQAGVPAGLGEADEQDAEGQPGG
jgi:predicted MFS family arabinose efflux permease